MDEYLLNHIYVEFRLGNKFSIDQWMILFETQGQVYNIESIRKCVGDFLSSQTVGEQKSTFRMTDKDFAGIKDLPFKHILIIFNISVNKEMSNFRNGSYSWQSFPEEPIITVNANGENIDELIHQCNKCICHELIHSVGDAGLVKNTDNRLMFLHVDNNYSDYFNAISDSTITDEEIKGLFKMLYWTDFAERKAFFGSLYGELCKHKGEFYNTEDAYKVLYKTEEWKGFERLRETVEKLNSYSGDKEKEKHILDIYNTYCQNNIRNYRSFLHLVNRRWRKMSDAMKEKAAKILYRVYCETEGYGGTIDIDEY